MNQAAAVDCPSYVHSQLRDLAGTTIVPETRPGPPRAREIVSPDGGKLHESFIEVPTALHHRARAVTPAGGSPNAAWVPVVLARTLGGYQPVKWIGSGNFGLVFEALRISDNKTVAIKVLPPNTDPQNALEFQTEGVLLKQLIDCEGVIDYIDTGVEAFQAELAPGVFVPLELRFHVISMAKESMDRVLLDPVTRSSLEWTDRLGRFRDAVKAIHQMHLHSVAHRDLKASNCLILSNGDVRLADLGRAKDLTAGPSVALAAYMYGRGDLRFAPPEYLYLQGGAGARDFVAADYYGLGSLLIEIISGHGLTALALGDFSIILDTAEKELKAGLRRDLSGLAPRYKAVISDVIDDLPASVRLDAQVLLTHLTHPDPGQRLVSAPYSKDRHSQDPLAWVLRRTDIMIKRLRIEARGASRVNRRARVSA